MNLRLAHERPYYPVAVAGAPARLLLRRQHRLRPVHNRRVSDFRLYLANAIHQKPVAGGRGLAGTGETGETRETPVSRTVRL
jgi:hypothetical protein